MERSTGRNLPGFYTVCPTRVDEILDLERGVQFLDKEPEQVFPPDNETFSPKIVDKLVKVFTREGHDEWILIHIEAQGKYTPDFGKRMFTYYYRLMDKYNKRIAAYAIFTEDSSKSRPNIFKIEFMGTEMTFRFNTFKIAVPTDAELHASENPFAIVVLAARAVLAGKNIKDKLQRDFFKKDLKIELIRKLQAKNIPDAKIRAIWIFINYYIRFELEETNIIYNNELEILNKNKATMGIEEQVLDMLKNEYFEEGERKGKIEGKNEGKNELKETLVRRYILDFEFTDQQIAKLLQVTLKYVKSIRSQELSVS